MAENVILDMDETRELKWTFKAIKVFEKRGREILKRMDVKNERGQSLANAPMHAGVILDNFLRIAEILEAAVGAACNISALDSKDKPSEASQAIDAYIERGGDLETLQNEIYRAYLLSTDPSSIADWEENIKKEEEAKRINRAKTDAKLELARMELVEDEAKIERLKTISGNQPTA